jgi:hypothetical protein
MLFNTDLPLLKYGKSLTFHPFSEEREKVTKVKLAILYAPLRLSWGVKIGLVYDRMVRFAKW